MFWYLFVLQRQAKGFSMALCTYWWNISSADVVPYRTRVAEIIIYLNDGLAKVQATHPLEHNVRDAKALDRRGI